MTRVRTAHAAIEAAIADVQLLQHDFYKRWECGDLAPAELAAYAEQYRRFEAMLPHYLNAILTKLADGDARSYVQANLDDEAGTDGRSSHLELFDSFVAATGADASAPATPATEALIATYSDVLTSGPAAALGGLVAYEMQSPAVAKTKGEALRAHFGFSATGTKFWDVHAELDVEHSEWAVQAIASLDTVEEMEAAIDGARRVAQAWWAFLDEREAAAPALTA